MNPPPVPPEILTRSAGLLPAPLLSARTMGLCWLPPILLMMLLNLQGYHLIEGNMNPSERALAHWIGWAGGLNFLLGGVFWGVMRWREKRTRRDGGELSAWWGLPVIAAQIAYLGLAFSVAQDLIPRSVERWIYPTHRYLYHQFALAMIPLFWGLVRLACIKAREVERKITIRNSLITIVGVPVFFFFLVRLVTAAGWDIFSYSFMSYVVVTLVVLVGVIILSGLIRVFVHVMLRVDRWSMEAQLGFIGGFALLMPWAGLTLNISIPFPTDFQAAEVYALATVNAVILGAACWLRERMPRVSLACLSTTLPFSLYFFVVFLPFLPLAPLAMIALGTGFLILTPTVLIVIHLVLIQRAKRVAGWSGVAIAVGCFLLLPGFFTVRGLADRAALNAALDFVYTPEISSESRQYPGNLNNLRRALDNHTHYKNGIFYPLLSDYYAWLVFDNLILPDDKLEHVQRSFFGATSAEEILRNAESRIYRRNNVRTRHAMPNAPAAARTVQVSQFEFRTAPLAPPTTRLTLRLELTNTGLRPAEFAQSIPLPPGVFVSGFRLQVMGDLVPGRIYEKKTALWVYTMIRDTERRDPGIVYYNSHDELELRVFPVEPTTPSIVEIDFTLPHLLDGPIQLTDAAGAFSVLQAHLQPRNTLAVEATGAAMTITGLASQNLPVSPRDFYIHLIIDRSHHSGFDGDLETVLTPLRQHFPNYPIRRIMLANFETKDTTIARPRLDDLPRRGGFLVDHALARAGRVHRDLDLDSAESHLLPPTPIFVILSDASSPRLSDLELTETWTDVLPSLELYQLSPNGQINLVAGGDAALTPVVRKGNSIRPVKPNHPVRFGGDTNSAPLQYWDPQQEHWRDMGGVESMPPDTEWARAIGLTNQHQDYARGIHPTVESLQRLIRESQRTGILIEPSSYIVVENAAQWRMLEQSEDQKLGQNAALDFRETPAPSTYWLIAGFGLWLVSRKRKRRCTTSIEISLIQ